MNQTTRRRALGLWLTVPLAVLLASSAGSRAMSASPHHAALRPVAQAAGEDHLPPASLPLPANSKQRTELIDEFGAKPAGLADRFAQQRRWIGEIVKAGGRPISTKYPGVEHNSFLWAYTEPALVEWLFARHR